MFVAPEVVPLVMPPEAVRIVPPVSRLTTLVMSSDVLALARFAKIVDPVAAMKTPEPRTLKKEKAPVPPPLSAKLVPEL